MIELTFISWKTKSKNKGKLVSQSVAKMFSFAKRKEVFENENFVIEVLSNLHHGPVKYRLVTEQQEFACVSLLDIFSK